MWVEQHKSGKVNFIERYKNPYTEKWFRVSVLMEKDTPRIRKEAQKQLEIKIANILSDLENSEMLLQSFSTSGGLSTSKRLNVLLSLH